MTNQDVVGTGGLGINTSEANLPRTPFQQRMESINSTVDGVNNPKWWTRRAQNLERMWGPRNDKMRVWYNILLLKNNLKKPGLESMIGNDPRTTFNLAVHILSRSFIRHGISIFEEDETKSDPLAALGTQIDTWWALESKRNQSRGRRPWVVELSQHMLATGWYAVRVDTDNIQAEILAPSQVYPDYSSDDGLIEVTHGFQISKDQSLLKALRMNLDLENVEFQVSTRTFRDKLKFWQKGNSPTDMVQWYDQWIITDDGVVNAIIVDGEFAKFPVVEVDQPRIPIFTGPSQGLPDRGELLNDEEWRSHSGEAFVAMAEELWDNYNRQLTYLQQLLRDTAQVRWKVKGNQSVTKEELERRGGVFKMQADEDISPIDGIAVPVELTIQLQTLSSMLQKSTFPSTILGDVTGQISALQMSQIAGAAQHVLSPYSDALTSLLGDIDNMWYGAVKENGKDPYNNKLPTNLPQDLILQVVQNLSVPGDALQRAQFSKMMNPEFQLSPETIIELAWPEIANPQREIAAWRASRALNSPEARQIDLITGLELQARIDRANSNPQSATLFESMAAAMRQRLTGPPQGESRPEPSPGMAGQLTGVSRQELI